MNFATKSKLGLSALILPFAHKSQICYLGYFPCCSDLLLGRSVAARGLSGLLADNLRPYGSAWQLLQQAASSSQSSRVTLEVALASSQTLMGMLPEGWS